MLLTASTKQLQPKWRLAVSVVLAQLVFWSTNEQQISVLSQIKTALEKPKDGLQEPQCHLYL